MSNVLPVRLDQYDKLTQILLKMLGVFTYKMKSARNL